MYPGKGLNRKGGTQLGKSKRKKNSVSVFSMQVIKPKDFRRKVEFF